MQIEVVTTPVEAADLLVLPVWEEAVLPEALHQLPDVAEWRGEARKTLLIYGRGTLPATRTLLIGMGAQDKGDAERFREAGALASQRARELKIDALDVVLPTSSVPTADAAQALAEGALLGLYGFQRYKSDAKAPHAVQTLRLSAADADAANVGVVAGTAVAHGVAVARDLANTPGADLPPAKLADEARALAQRFGMTSLILDKAQLTDQGFGGILAVGQGSVQEPRFIVLEHGGPQPGAPTICLVGKGITFDTGGISIKPAENMDQMKFDMGGAAAVLGAMHAIGEMQLPLHVVALISAAENMPSGSAYRPGDIVTTLSGKTVEVLNTDAEGRIVMADALFYAQRYNPAAIIDLATLTGAIMVALGPHATGMMTNNDALAERLARAGDAAGELLWRMPLNDTYREMVKSDIADIKNTSGRYGGAIGAAAFLEHFVGDIPWAHWDIAGTGWVDRQVKPYTPKGSTGVGVRALVAALRGWAAEAA